MADSGQATALKDNRVQEAKKHMVKNAVKAASFHFKSSFWKLKEDSVPEINVGTGPLWEMWVAI